jgi:hypothetical protein
VTGFKQFPAQQQDRTIAAGDDAESRRMPGACQFGADAIDWRAERAIRAVSAVVLILFSQPLARQRGARSHGSAPACVANAADCLLRSMVAFRDRCQSKLLILREGDTPCAPTNKHKYLSNLCDVSPRRCDCPYLSVRTMSANRERPRAASGRVGVHKATQRQRRHVGNIAVTKVTAPAHRQHGGNALQV